MNQINLIEPAPADPPAEKLEHGGYLPCGKALYRGHLAPVAYLHDHGMRTLRLPVLFWLMDMVIEALADGPVHWLDLLKTGWPVNPGTLSKHLGLMESIGLISAEPVFYGSESPAQGNYRGYHNRYHLVTEKLEAA